MRQFSDSSFAVGSLCFIAAATLASFVLAAVCGSVARAACQPDGTPKSDTIICSGVDFNGISSGDGGDSVTILEGARILLDVAGPDARATGVDAGAQDDTVSNAGDVTVTVLTNLTTATLPVISANGSPQRLVYATNVHFGSDWIFDAIGIDGGPDKDFISNTGTLNVTAATDSAGRSVSAAGIVGGNGNDEIRNDGTLTVSSTSSIGGPNFSLSLAGGEDVDATTTLDAQAVGIAAGNAKDQVTNNGSMSVKATAEVDGVNVEVNLIDLSHANTSTTVRSNAVGIEGGNGKDAISIGNTGALSAEAVSRSKSVAVEANLVDAAVSDSTLEVDARATGIAAGSSRDTVDNAGSVKASATSEVTDVGVNVSFIDATVAEGRGSNLSTTLNAAAVGIDSGKGKDDIAVASTGSVEAIATSTAHSVGVSVASEGVPGPTVTLFKEGGLASVGITSNSDATGIATGQSHDQVHTEGTLTANASSTARQESINVGIAVLDFHVPTPGIVLGSAGTQAEADAAGIATDGGHDHITNAARVDVDADATAFATTVSVNIAELSVDLAPDFPSGPPVGASLVVADTVTEATARAVGIDSGTGDDWVENTNVVESNATATGGSTSAAATLDVKYEDGDNFFAIDAVGARATTQADATAVGIDGGSGKDELSNTSRVAAGATADGNTVSVGVVVSGTLNGNGGALNLAATDTSTTGTAAATGMQGGAGDDKITNSGTVEAISDADVDGVNVNVSAAVAEKGLVAGVALARSVSEATAGSVGIDGGSGKDQIENTNTVTSNATADAGAVAVSVNIDGTTRGAAGGAAVTDAHTTATAAATGLRSGGAADGDKHGNHDDDGDHHHRRTEVMGNSGTINVDAQAHTHSVGVSADVAVAEKGVAIGVPLAITSANATSTAKGIEADGDDNDIENAGGINVKSGAGSTAVSVSLSVVGTTAGLAAGAALTDSSVIVQSNATGVAAGAGDDHVTNSGSITFNQAESNATAVSVSAAGFVAQSGVAIGAALGRTEANATTNGAAIEGGSGDDKLVNNGTITMDNVNAHADAVGVSLGVGLTQTGLGVSGALVDGDSTATVTASGIDGGSGDDKLINTSAIALRHGVADADAVSVAVNITGAQSGVALGGALVDADAVAHMTAAGMSGGSGDDALINKSSITVEDVNANSDAVGVSASLTVAQSGVAAGGAFAFTGARVDTSAKGIDGGDGEDFIYSEGEGESDSSVTLRGIKSEADAVSVSVGMAGGSTGLFIGAGLADASGHAETVATAIDGGARDDVVINKGKVVVDDVRSDAHATGVSVALAGTNAGVAAGVSIVNTSGEAKTRAKGIDGGSGDDYIASENAITLKQMKSNADAVSVGVSLGVAISGGVAGGIALSNAAAEATTEAVGIDGGSGDDHIVSTAAVTLDGVEANTRATGVSVQLGVTNAGVGIGGALVDTHTTANAHATALNGATGDDVLVNQGDVLLRGVKADAGATSVGVTVNGTISGGVAAGVSLTDASSHATTTATGMDGSDGDDKLINKGTIRAENVEANARATGVSISAQASFAGIAAGAAIADTSGSARTTVKGVDGGAGDDQLYNEGTVNVAGKSKADALSLGISVSGTIGIAGGAQLTNADMTAETATTGLDGGRGRDHVANSGDVTASADAQTDSKAISVGVSIGVGGDASLADATTIATATAVGIDGGEAVARKKEHGHKKKRSHGHDDRDHDDDHHDRHGHKDKDEHDDRGDEILNDGAVVANATTTGRGTSAGGNLFGFALGELTNTSTARAAGIQTDDAEDKVQSNGSIAANANAAASGLSVAVSLGGKAMGDVSTTADASAAGIATGGARDDIETTGTITVDARSNASANGVSVGVLGVAEADASVKALATAVGVDGGEDDDNIVNRGSITASAGAPTDTAGAASCPVNADGTCARVSGVSVNMAGAGFLDATTEARSAATGIAGGSGEDHVDSDGAVSATARAKTVADGVNVNIFGAAQSDAKMTAAADATGINGGDDDDRIHAKGSISAASSSHIVISNFGFSLGGVADFDATLDASAAATAIDGGTGHDKILNSATLTTRATSTTSSGGNSVVVFGASGSGAQSGAFADATGIRGGTDGDIVGNSGVIDARSSTNLSLGSSTFTFGGGGGAGGKLTATTNSRGITGDGGHDLIVNEGRITVDAGSTLNASSGSTVVFGAGSGGAGSGASTRTVGIDGGADGDGILNQGALTAASRSTLTLSGSSFTFGGAGGARGSLTADTAAVGIAGGGDIDAIGNEADITASATSTLSASGDSDVAFGSSSSGADAGAVTDARGIDGGSESDFVHNSGKITATSNATLTLSGGSFTFGGAGGTSGTLTATTRSTALASGAGKDVIKNEGELRVTNTSTLTSSGDSDVAFGSSGANSSAGSVAESNGIDSGEDNDFIWSAGKIIVTSVANLTLSGSSYTFGGTGDVGGRLSSTTRSVGIQGGGGNDFIGSEADISVAAKSTLGSNGRINTTFGTSASGAVVSTDIGTIGIDGGSGDDVIKNHARVDAKSDATVTSTSGSYVFGGSTSNDDVASASSHAAGLRGGDGDDFIFNDGDVQASAEASISASGRSNAEFGGSSSSGEVVSSLVARGVDGGAGDDEVVNEGTITAIGTSSASMSHNTDTGFLFGGGDSRAKARTALTAYGIDMGEGDNSVWNKGSVTVDLFGTSSVDTDSDGADIFDGDAFSRSDSVVNATATGIRTGDGNDWIENEGNIDVKTWRQFEIELPFGLPSIFIDVALGASSDADADGDGIDGDGTIRSFATSNLTAVGIDASGGKNHIENSGRIDVDARAQARATGSVDADAGGSTSAVRDARVSAHAFGIRTHDGDDHVVNTGVIRVTTRADNNTGSGDITASATGIDTGAGNDTIINAGTITATRIVNGTSSRGTAINAGAGDDLIELRDGSITNGDVDLGSGSDLLSLEGTPVINGSFFDALSTVTLVFNNSGSFSGGLPGVTAIKNGEGTFSLSMLNSMERIEVNQGTLKLINDYRFRPDGVFQAKVYGNGTHGQFYVDGETTLDGTMKIVRGGGAYRDGTTFDVFATSNFIEQGSKFSDVELPEPRPLLRFDSAQLTDKIQIRADVESFTLMAQAGNQMAVARHLDRILPTVSGDLHLIMGEVQALPSPGQFATAFASLGPAAYTGHTVATTGSLQQYTGALRDRMAELRLASLSPSKSEPVRLAYGGTSVSNLLAGAEPASGRSADAWIKAFGQKGDQDPDANGNGFEYDLSGFALGFDRPFGRSATLGLSLGTARNEVESDFDMSEGDIDSTLVSLYANYFDQRLYVDGVLSLGRNQYDTRRNIIVGMMTTPVTSSHDGNVLSATLGAGYYFQLGAWWVDPFIYAQYTRLEEDGFTETGSGALTVDDRSTRALVSTLGVRLSRIVESAGGGLWIPEASVAWLHNHEDDDQVINASYVDVPDATFSVDGLSFDRNGTALSVGLGYRTTGGLTTSLRYANESRDDFRAQSIVGELRMEF